jgi:hypothetical protein
MTIIRMILNAEGGREGSDTDCRNCELLNLAAQTFLISYQDLLNKRKFESLKVTSL